MRSRKRAAFIENVICLCLLVVTPLLAAYPYISKGNLPISLGDLSQLPPWESAWENDAAPQPNPAWVNQAQHFPALRFLNESMQAKEAQWPLWNPLEGCGVPFFALWRTRMLSPFTLPFLSMPWQEALPWSFLLKLCIAGCCAYYAGRRFGLPPAMALLFGVAWQLSGPIFLYAGAPLSDTVVWLPLLIVAAERLLLGQWRAWPLVALILALMALGGEPEALTLSMLFLAVYFLMRQWRDRRRVHAPTAFTGLALGFVGACALIAVQLLPYWEYYAQSVAIPAASGAMLFLDDLIALLSPLASDASRQDSLSLIYLIYPGAVQFLLLGLWFALRRYAGRDLRRRMESLFWTGVIFFGFGLISAGFLHKLPILNLFQTKHFLIFHAFTLAFLTAAGAEVWNELDPDQCKATLKRLVVTLPLLWGLPFIALVVLGLRSGSGAFSFLLPSAVALAMLLLLAFTLIRPNMRVLGYGLSAITVWALIGSWAAVMPSMPEAYVFPETKFIKTLKNHEAMTRVTGSPQLAQWPLAGNGIAQTYTTSGRVIKRYADFLEQSKADPLLLRRTGSRALLLTKEDMQGAYAAVRSVLHIQTVFETGAILFDDVGAKARARMIYCGRSAQDTTQGLDSSASPLLEGMRLPETDAGKKAVANIKEDSPNRVVVQVEHTRPGVLVLADTWYPGWQAQIDGKKTAVHPVDGMFRGVEVGEGAHEIIFEFHPWSLRIGSYISLGSLLFVLVSLRHVIFHRRRAAMHG